VYLLLSAKPFFSRTAQPNTPFTHMSSRAVPSREQILSLYRHLIRGGKRFVDYNFREYTLRITREDFRKFAAEKDPAKVNELYQFGAYYSR
jgi:Complex 1 protein (LYR family)